MNEQWLLTAASCVPNPTSESIEDMKIEISKSKDWLDVQEVLLHPEYNRTGMFEAKNDIALVRVNEQIQFDAVNGPACLYDKPSSYFNDKLHFAGQSTSANLAAF